MYRITIKDPEEINKDVVMEFKTRSKAMYAVRMLPISGKDVYDCLKLGEIDTGDAIIKLEELGCTTS